MRVLYFTKYTRKGASSRLRSLQYIPVFKENNIYVEVQPLFNDAYLDDLYNGKKTSLLLLLKAYLTRFIYLFKVFNYDKIIIEKELFPFFFSWFERILKLLGVKYIVDYDDAIFHNYDLSSNKVIAFLLGKKIDNVMKFSNCVLAGNDYLAERAKKAGAKNIVKIPTVIDLERYKVKTDYSSSQIVIGWIGSPSTLWHLKPFPEVFNELVETYNVKIVIIGTTEEFGVRKNIEYLRWTEDSEVDEILKFDIGIMPLTNTPWVLGKCAYKLIQYMGCAIPVVASPVGMNSQVVDDNVDGFLAATPQEWKVALEKLILDENLRRNFGKAGREKVEAIYNLEVNSKKIIEVLQKY